MKDYVKPTMTLVLLKTEERLAASKCACSGTNSEGQIFYTSYSPA